MNVLITSASRKVSLIQAFQRALRSFSWTVKKINGIVVAVDANPDAPALYFADKHRISPLGLEDDYLSFVRDICNEFQISLIVPTRDAELSFFAKNRIEFSYYMGVKVMIADIDTIEICQDKKRFVSYCNDHGFDTPKTYGDNSFTGLPDIPAFPVFVRPSTGSGSGNAYKINSWSEFDCVIDTIDNPVVQEYIYAQEYTIDLFSDFDSNVISIVPRKRIHIFGGESFVGQLFATSTL